MGDIKIKITEITIPNDFRIYYKVGNTPYPFDGGYTDYGVIYSGGTEVINLIGDFNYGEEYWIMGREIDYPERWMVKNILINDSIAYASFVVITPTPTPTITPTISISRTPLPTITISRTPTITPTITVSRTMNATPSRTPSKTPVPTRTPSKTPTPSVTPSRNGQPVQITNFDGMYSIARVSINGVYITDAAFPITPGTQSIGSTLQLGTNMTVVIYFSDPINNEHVVINNVICTTILGGEYDFGFSGVDTTNGVVIDYWTGTC